MLQDIRKHARGKAAKVVVAGIAVVLCSFGLESLFSHLTGFGASKDKSLIHINGEAVSRASIDKQIASLKASGQLAEGMEADARKELQQQLVVSTLLTQYMNNGGLRVSSDEALQALAFQLQAKDMDDARAKLQQLARQYGASPEALLDMQQRFMQSQLLEEATKASVWSTPSERQRLLALQQEKRTFRYKVLSSRELGQGVDVSQQEMQQYYDANKAAFMRPEQVRFNYVLLDRDAMSASAPVDDAVLRQAYERRLAAAHPRVSDIIITISSTRDEAAARARMAEAQQRLDQGESFASVARRYSDDSASASRGGDLGSVDADSFGNDFYRQVQPLKAGQRSKPFVLDGAVHLVQVTGLDVGSFDSMKAELTSELRQQQSDGPYDKAVRKLGDLVDESDDFNAVAKALGVPMQTSDWVAQADRKPFDNPKVMAEAFDPSVKDKGYNSQVIRLDDHRTMVLHVIESRAAQQLNFDEVRDQVRARVEQQKVAQAIDARGRQLAQQLQQGNGSVDGWSQVRDAGRSSVDVEPAVLAAAFTVTRPNGDQPQYAFRSLGNGERGVIIMLQKTSVDTSASLDERLGKELDNANSRAVLGGLVEQLQHQAKIEE